MTVPDRRAYHSPQRAEQANATRGAIVESAERLFAKHGYASVTMRAIARDAGVSLATLYVYFAGKPAIVAAIAEAVTASPDLSVERVEQANDAESQLRIGAKIIRKLNDRSWGIVGILRSARGADASLAEEWDRWQERHLHAIERAVHALDARRALRHGLSVDEAVDALYALAGTEVYRLLVQERGWTPDRYEGWLFELACRELLGSAPVENGQAPEEILPERPSTDSTGHARH